MEGYPLDRIRQMFETNTLGALRIIQAVLPALAKAGFRRHRECVECERPRSPRRSKQRAAPPSSRSKP